MRPFLPILLLAALSLGASTAAHGDGPDSLGTSPHGPLEFTPAPTPADSLAPAGHTDAGLLGRVRWLSAPIGERLLTEPDAWLERHHDGRRFDVVGDYNRVDLLRIGLSAELQDPSTMMARVGGRYEYATGRRRALYGVQVEQPLLPGARLALGVSMSRRTDHGELQQMDDLENSLALLFARQDSRDYFEREGFGAYVAWRVPDFSVVSVQVRNDAYRSLAIRGRVPTIFGHHHALRDNPAVDEGEVHAWSVRLDRQARSTARTRAGFYHRVELERAGYGMGGDFRYTRALADLRGVLRLSPTAVLALRAVGGTTASGALPAQKEFTVGGVDGLRAHAFAQYRGDQLLLAQAEYTTALSSARPGGSVGGLHAIVFVDAGRAWDDTGHAWGAFQQAMQVDGGFGLTTAEDNLRIYVARSLQQSRSEAVVSVRLQRPF